MLYLDQGKHEKKKEKTNKKEKSEIFWIDENKK